MNYYTVGKIVNTHGIKGELKIKLITDSPEQRFKAKNQLAIFNKDEKVLDVTIKSSRFHKGFMLVIFDGLEDINKVEKYKNFDLKIAEDKLDEPQGDNFYYHEIVGLTVINQQTNEAIGTIKEILEYGANDVWVVDRKGKNELLLPAIYEVIKDVDLDNGVVYVEMMDGLDDEN